MSILRNVKLLLGLSLLGSSVVCKAEEFPADMLQERAPMMAQYYSGCKSLNQYIATRQVEALEEALYKMNPKRMDVSIFEPDSTEGTSNLCEMTGHFMYDYEYALALYEDRELPKEIGLQRAGGECKVSLIALNPMSSIVYRVSAMDDMEMMTICEPGSVVTLSAKECTTGTVHEGKLYDNDTVCHASWTMDEDTIEIRITNKSGHATSLAFLIN